MTIARNLACLIASAAVLAACSKPPAGAAPQASAPAGAAAVVHAVAASDSEGPDMKPGLWEIHMSHTGGGATHAGVTQQCLDAASIADGKKTATDYAKAHCSKNETHGGGGRWVSDLVCAVGGSTMTTHSVTTMPDRNAYHTDLTTTYDPPTAGRAGATTTVDGKWLSECKAS